LDGCVYLDLQSQLDSPFEIARELPVGHYSRKNIGYLEAYAKGAEIIVETDDDNYPLAAFWNAPARFLQGRMVDRPGWLNSYSYFSASKAWPRGLPLDQVQSLRTDRPEPVPTADPLDCPIQQSLANGDTDVDAVYRMVEGALVEFNEAEPLILGENVWGPFNSQSTIWWEDAFPLMYLPSTCTFRMTDIWRSLVAQRCMWECGWRLAFIAPTVHQNRNYHDLARDFELEVPGYLHNDAIRKSLSSLSLDQGITRIGGNMVKCYQQLVAMNLIDEVELQLLGRFLDDLARIRDSEFK
jgi:hypothetical protein